MNKEIDKILYEIEERGYISFNMDDSEERLNASRRLQRLNLIRKKNKYSYDLTEKGQIAVDMGGYENYLKYISKEKLKENKIKELTIKQLKGNIFQIKNWWWLLIINAIISIIASNLNFFLELISLK